MAQFGCANTPAMLMSTILMSESQKIQCLPDVALKEAGRSCLFLKIF